MTTEPRRRRTKDEVEAAIAEAVLKELDEVGYTSLTFEGVARRAQVSRPVLYRRFSTRVSLVLSVVTRNVRTTYAKPPETGSLRGDLIAWLQEAESQMSQSRSATLRGILGEASESEMRRATELMNARPDDMERCVLEPARIRGEITGEVPRAVSRLFYILARDRAVFGTQAETGSADDEKDSTQAQRKNSTQIVDEIILPLLLAHAGRPTEQLIIDQSEIGREP